jgi:hypothetical protein
MIGKLKIAAVLAGALATAGFAAPASAHEHEGGRFGWRGGWERRYEHERAARWEHERREREWREQEWRREHAYSPYYNGYNGYYGTNGYYGYYR